MGEAVWCMIFRNQDGIEVRAYSHLVPPEGSVIKIGGEYYQETRVVEIDYDAHAVRLECYGP
jgi:hypothetical protein